LIIKQSQWLDEGALDLPGVNKMILDRLPEGARREIIENVPPQMLPD
jgi:hypothetical protein